MSDAKTPGLASIESASKQAPIGVEIPEWKKTGIYPISLLKRLNSEEPKWVVENLIREGNQVVLSGPPKSGKTILAMQLAIDVSLGNEHFILPKYRIPKKRSVLFLSLEMKQRALSIRLKKQLRSFDSPDLKFMFGIPGKEQPHLFSLSADHESVKIEDEAKILQKIIRTEKPDLIVVDSLIQVHSLDENNNMKMGSLMRHLRRLFSTQTEVMKEDYDQDVAGEIDLVETKHEDTNEVLSVRYFQRNPIAHVIIHHTRKISEVIGRAIASPDSIRGAGAIHSEADLAITLANSFGNRVTINKSSRELAGEQNDYFSILSDNARLRIEPAPPKDAGKAEFLAQIYNGLKSSGAVFSDTVQKELLKQGQLKRLFTGKTPSGFHIAFAKKLEDLNLHKPKKGAGNKTKIELRPDVTLSDFLLAFDMEVPDTAELEAEKAISFTPVPPDPEAPKVAAKTEPVPPPVAERKGKQIRPVASKPKPSKKSKVRKNHLARKNK